MTTPIDKLYNDFNNLNSYLLQEQKLDYLNFVNKNFQKTLLISSASYIENELQNILILFVDTNTKNKFISSL